MHQSNYAFLQDLAALNRYAVWVEDGTLFFKQTRPTRNRLALEWGRTLQSFTPRISTAGLVRKVVVKGYDPIQQGFAGAADSPTTLPVGLSPSGLLDVESGSGGRSELVIEGAPVASEVEAKAYAQAILDQIWQGAVTGSGTSPGQPEIRVGTVLALSRIGRFSGDYVVTSVTHSVDEGGYHTSFEVNGGTSFTGRDPAAAGVGGMAGGGLSGRTAGGGVVVGIVQENQDPDGLGRVRVRLPGVTDQPITHWARVAAPMAGAGRGFYFLPEKEDEVLVAFEHGDPARPYVLGALWSGRHKPPLPNTGANDVRLIRTRSGHILRFDDKGGAEKIELIDASGNSSLVIDTAAQDGHDHLGQGRRDQGGQRHDHAAGAEDRGGEHRQDEGHGRRRAQPRKLRQHGAQGQHREHQLTRGRAMGAPAAKKGDRVTATDMHLIQPPVPAPPVLLPHPFSRGSRRGAERRRQHHGPAGGDGGQHRQQHAAPRPWRRPTAAAPGRRLRQPAGQPGQDHVRQRHGVHQRQGGSARGRPRFDLQRPERPAGRDRGRGGHGAHRLTHG